MLTFIPKAAQQTNTWSGGTTTQLWIYPETASYLDRNFECRISTATIDTAVSDFSDLTGYTRHLMTLTHPITLFEGLTEAFELEPLVEHIFDGGVPMRSIGKTRDFNVMLKTPWQARITVLSDSADTPQNPRVIYRAFYVLSGTLTLQTPKQTIIMNESDFAICDTTEIKIAKNVSDLKALSIDLWK